MKRRKKGRGSHGRNPSAIASYFPAIQSKRISGTIPQIAGLAANGFLTTLLANKIPYTKTGVGKYILSAVGASVIGAVASKFFGKDVGEKAMNGGFVATGAMLVADVTSGGFSALTNLSGNETTYDDDMLNVNALYGYGVGDFVTPPQTGAAQDMPSQTGQYPLPQSVPIPPELQWAPGGNQKWMPGGNQGWAPGGNPFNPGGNQAWKPGASDWNPVAVPPAPAAPPGSAAAVAEVVAKQANSGQMNDYESSILGSVIGEHDTAFSDMSNFA